MVSFTVRMTFRQEDRAEVAEQLKAIAVESRKEPGCVTYVPHVVEHDADTVFIYEQYVDEAAVEFHKATPHFAQYAVGGFYQKMLDRQMEMLVALV